MNKSTDDSERDQLIGLLSVVGFVVIMLAVAIWAECCAGKKCCCRRKPKSLELPQSEAKQTEKVQETQSDIRDSDNVVVVDLERPP